MKTKILYIFILTCIISVCLCFDMKWMYDINTQNKRSRYNYYSYDLGSINSPITDYRPYKMLFLKSKDIAENINNEQMLYFYLSYINHRLTHNNNLKTPVKINCVKRQANYINGTVIYSSKNLCWISCENNCETNLQMSEI